MRRAEESVALNRVSGEDLDEKVTTKSGPGEVKEGNTGWGLRSGWRNAEREGQPGTVEVCGRRSGLELNELEGEAGEGEERTRVDSLCSE